MPIYVLHLIGGTENKVFKTLIRKGYTVYLPREIAIIRQHGKYKEQERLLIPSYIFIDTILSDTIYYDVAKIDGVIRFLGKPITPLSEADEDYIKWFGNNGEIIRPSDVIIDNGVFKAVSGILKDNEDRIINYDKRQNRAKVRVNIGDTPKTVNLSVKFKVNPEGRVDSLPGSKD